MARFGRSFPPQPGARPRLVAASTDAQGAATLTGDGALSAGATATAQATASLAGAGALTAGATPVAQASATLAGAGALTAGPTASAQAAVSMAGAGALSATAGAAGSATLAGAGALTAGAQSTQQVAATLAGAGALSAGARSTQQVAAALAGAGSLTATGARVQPAAATLAGAGAFSAAGTRVHAAAAALAGAGSLVASGHASTSGVLNVALWAVDRTTGALIALPRWRRLSFSRIQGTPGAISVEYPADGAGFDTLRANVTADRDLEVEIWLGGRASTALRGILQVARGDDVAPGAVWTFSGAFLEQLLAEVVVYPVASAEKQELRFTAASPGSIVASLLSLAQARGALAGMTTDCTGTLDSSGAVWPEFAMIRFSPGVSYLSVLQRLVSLGLIEFEVTPARVLRVYRPGYQGVDRTVGAFPTIIRRGRNVTESPRSHSVQESVTTVLAAGAEGLYATASDAPALARRGRRIEGTASSANLTDLGAVQAFAGRTLVTQTPGEMELLLGLSFGVGQPRPQTHYAVGDWVYADSTGTLERLRVAQLTLDIDEGGPAGSVTLNDLRTDWRIRAERRLSALQDGDVVIGTSTQSPGEDTVAPAAPTGVTVGSDAYQSDGLDSAVVYVGWTAPTTNSDGSALFDLAGFRARLEVPGAAPGVFTTSPDVGATATSLQFSGVQTGVGVRITVAAFDRDGNASAWSSPVDHTTESDTTAPPAPSTPVATPYLGQLKIRWDGLSNVGSAMPLDLDRVEVHLSTTNNFTPSAATLIDQFATEAGERVAVDLAYGTTYYVKLRAVDRTGNVGPASAQASSVPEQVVSADVFAGAIGTAQLADAAITTAKINNLAVNDAKIGDLSVGKLTAGALTATVTLSGIFRTAATGRRMEIDSAGWRAYKTDGTTKVAELNITGETMLMTGTYQSGISGERINLLPDGTMRVYGASGSDYAQIANDGGIVHFTSRADGSGRRSYVNFDPDGFSAQYGSSVSSWISRFDLGLTYGVINSPVCGIRIYRNVSPADGSANRFHMLTANGVGSDDGNSVLHMYGRRSGSGDRGTVTDNMGLIRGAARGCGIVWYSGSIDIVGGTDSTFGPINASAFNVNSSALVKSEPAEVAQAIPAGARAVLHRAPARAWYYLDDLAPRPDKPGTWIRETGPDGVARMVEQDWLYPEQPARLHFGPIAEELRAVSEHLAFVDAGGRLMTDVRDTLGVLWAATAEVDAALTARLDALAERVARLEGPVLDMEVTA